MKQFLLKQYITPSTDLSENRSLISLCFALFGATMTAGMMGDEFIWFGTVYAVMATAVLPQRPNALEATSPISGRDVAVVRLLLALGTGLTTFVITSLIAAANGHAGATVPNYVLAVEIVVLGALLPRLVRPSEFIVKRGITFIPLLLLGGASILSITFLDDRVTLLWLAIAIVAAAIAWWRTVPVAYQRAALAATANARASTVAITNARSSWWIPLRTLMLAPQRFILLPMMFAGGGANQWWMLAFVGVLLEEAWRKADWFRPFPLSQRQRFWLVMGPGVLLPCVVMLLGMLFPIPVLRFTENLRRRAPGTYKQEATYFDSPTSVSMEYWNVAPNGVVPTITAPWGETAQPYVIKVFDAVYYNPYTSRLNSSAQFAEWQFRRLTTAVYGFPVELKDYDWRAKQPRRMTEMPRMVVINTAAVVLALMCYLLALGMGKVARFWKRSTVIAIIASTAPLIPMGFSMLVTKRYGVPQGTTDIVFPLIERSFLQLSAALPSSTAVVVVLAALPILAMYFLLEWQFGKSEMIAAAPKEMTA